MFLKSKYGTGNYIKDDVNGRTDINPKTQDTCAIVHKMGTDSKRTFLKIGKQRMFLKILKDRKSLTKEGRPKMLNNRNRQDSLKNRNIQDRYS